MHIWKAVFSPLLQCGIKKKIILKIKESEPNI